MRVQIFLPRARKTRLEGMDSLFKCCKTLGCRGRLSPPSKSFPPWLSLTQIRSRAKIEKIRASLFNSSDLIGLSTLDGEDELMEMSSEEILTVSTVNQSLFDTQGSPALEDYFSDKTMKGACLWVCLCAGVFHIDRCLVHIVYGGGGRRRTE